MGSEAKEISSPRFFFAALLLHSRQATMRVRQCSLLLFALFLGLPLLAQTYAPKTIKLRGADDLDRAEVMRLIDLKPGVPVTKDQIEQVMQRLADSGLFTEMSYRVGPEALVFELTPAAGAQALTVQYSNFVWWQPGELEAFVEARVPDYHGRVPLTGPQTNQVKAALVALLAEKGVAGAQVAARLAPKEDTADRRSDPAGIGVLVLSITQPSVRVGTIQLPGTAPAVSAQMNNVVAHLASSEFDNVHTRRAIVENTLDTHRNGGFLDAAVDLPTISAPRSEAQGFVVDAVAAVHPGDLYHVSAIHFEGVPAGMESDLAKATGLKAGDAAGEMNLHIAEGLAARALENRGLLDASAKAEIQKDSGVHTVAYRFVMVPGPVYTFAGVDTSALPKGAQERFAADFHAQPGVVADAALRTEMFKAVRSAGAGPVGLNARRDRTRHTVSYAVVPKTTEVTANAASN